MGALTCTRPLHPNSSRHLQRLHKQANDKSRAITRRRCVNVKAFRSDVDGVMLPMDAYRVRMLAYEEKMFLHGDALLTNAYILPPQYNKNYGDL